MTSHKDLWDSFGEIEAVICTIIDDLDVDDSSPPEEFDNMDCNEGDYS